ncbi:MAG: hypothetical protein NW203_06860 [Hyphomonadaceae bacterium]|nr:hypothetical protein [Hyphomonadaceae bacterium]
MIDNFHDHDASSAPGDGGDAPSPADVASYIYLLCREMEAMAASAGFADLARRLAGAREAAGEALRAPDLRRDPSAHRDAGNAAPGDAA